LIKHLADRMNVGFFIWSASKGLRRVDDDEIKGSVYQTVDLALALGHVESSNFPAIYHFQGVTEYFEDKILVTRLKDTAKTFTEKTGAIIITGINIDIPEQLKPYCAVINIPEPEKEEYQELLHHILRDLQSKMDVEFKLDTEDLNKLLNNLRGLTLMEAEKVLTKSIVEDGALAPDDINKVIEEKIKVVEREGLLEYYPNEETMDSVADLRGLKSWLAKRKEIILQPEKAVYKAETITCSISEPLNPSLASTIDFISNLSMLFPLFSKCILNISPRDSISGTSTKNISSNLPFLINSGGSFCTSFAVATMNTSPFLS